MEFPIGTKISNTVLIRRLKAEKPSGSAVVGSAAVGSAVVGSTVVGITVVWPVDVYSLIDI